MSVQIKIDNAVKKYGNNVIIPSLNLTIKEGEFFTLLGPSGCGKTTLLRMIAGFNSIEGGDFYFNDTRVNDMDPAKRNIGMVFQNYAIFPNMTVRKNVAFGLKNRKLERTEIAQRTERFLDLMKIQEYADRMPDRLSGGQQQRVALARALAIEPDVLLMDEPLSNLDAKLRVQMRIEISKLHQRLETTIIYVTHDQTEALTLGTRIVVMKDGVVQQVDSPLDLYMRPNNLFVAGFIGSPQMNFIDAKVVVSGSEVRLMFGSNSIKLPENKAKKLIDNGYEDKTVTFGIRPEDIKDEEMFISNSPDTTLEATVKVYEMLGAEVFLYFTVETFDITVRVNPRTTARPGDTIKIALDGSKIHLFDKETQETITN